MMYSVPDFSHVSIVCDIKSDNWVSLDVALGVVGWWEEFAREEDLTTLLGDFFHKLRPVFGQQRIMWHALKRASAPCRRSRIHTW